MEETSMIMDDYSAYATEMSIRDFVHSYIKLENDKTKCIKAINKKHEKLKLAEAQRDWYKAQCELMDKTLDKIIKNAEWDGDADVNVIIEALRSERDILISTIRARDEKINQLERRLEKYEKN